MLAVKIAQLILGEGADISVDKILVKNINFNLTKLRMQNPVDIIT